MNYFEDVYLKRLNRYGYDYQSRIQAQREEVFEGLLLKSIYRVDFVYEDEMHPGLLERYKQDETETMQYLLTRVGLNMPNGTLLMIPDKDMKEQPWLVYWLESIKSSGYNRYIVLKMTHFITWRDRSNIERSTWCYLYGQEDNMLKDEIKSRSRMNVLYRENLKLSFMVMPKNPYIKKDVYFEIGEGAFKEGYVITGYDLLSTPGVEFVSYDPVYLYDNSPAPTRPEGDTSDDYYWLEGGEE